ncbi:MAG: 3-deoxy-8-phosphooctulonate synthase [Clostridia bacterium]|nr:3-deoxy-8-phosphooctulonate synthase [Deltaproteobacteria bacterium]
MTAVADLFEAKRFTLIAGPCVVEAPDMCLRIAERVKSMCDMRGVSYIFKASYDKANRTAGTSFRGHGADEGLATLARVRKEIGVPVLTDIHEGAQAAIAAEVVDVLQIPAFLCRQTDLLLAAAKTGKAINVKKGQFAAPEDMKHAVKKVRDGGGKHIALTERGATFGYHNLVVDMRGLIIMRETSGCPVVFDATHSVQRPSSGDGVSGGERRFAPVLARAAAAVGIDGLFCEVHPDPDKALSDGPNSMTFEMLERTLDQVVAINTCVRDYGCL